MSFSLTTPQIRSQTKTVTRRLGWASLKPGELVQACEKCMGLGRGGKVQRLAVIRIKSNQPEPLNAIDQADCGREGFPAHSPSQFVEMFSKFNDCDPSQIIHRIEFEYV